MTEVWDTGPLPPTQLDRIEAMLKQLTAPKKRKPRAAKKNGYPDWFESVWNKYPNRAGSNPKSKAYSALSARMRHMTDKEVIFFGANTVFNGVFAYRLFCDATGKTGTEYVMQAATFFGPERHYLEDFTIPKDKSMPYQDEELESWAKKQGFRKADLGETYHHYRSHLKGMI